MDQKNRISRRKFLIGTAVAVGGSALFWTRRLGGISAATAQDTPLIPRAYLPIVTNGYISLPPLAGKVVHIHSTAATHWGSETDYWNHVDQAVVNNMVDQGLMALTGTGTVADAWRTLIPGYQPGQKVAIKVNFNNSTTCNNTSGIIDALIEPVNAVAGGLLQIGVQAEDICVYDAVRALPWRFVNGDLHGVRFFDGLAGNCGADAGFSYTPETQITFYPPPGVSVAAEYVPDVLMNATYLINMPIMKGSHSLAGVTLGFKNHFGTIHNCAGLHDQVNVRGQPGTYRSDYNPLVDLIRSPLIGGKTVLTIGDGLFAAKNWVQPPVTWTTFGDQVPNSLFFARDPVAIDCVMHDLLLAEPGTSVCPDSNNYLRLAGEARLGVFEPGDPHGSGYQRIQYLRIEV
jgi:hypothetical protein